MLHQQFQNGLIKKVFNQNNNPRFEIGLGEF